MVSAVRELNFPYNFRAADYSHPGDNSPAVFFRFAHSHRAPVRRDVGAGDRVSVRGAVRSGEGHLPSRATGSITSRPLWSGRAGRMNRALVGLDTGNRVSGESGRRCTQRPPPGSRVRARFSIWKAYAPAFLFSAWKVAVEKTTDRAMRGREVTGPYPMRVRTGWTPGLLGCPGCGCSRCRCRAWGQSPEGGHLETPTPKEAFGPSYQAQRLIDLAGGRLRSPGIAEPLARSNGWDLHQSHHITAVIRASGSGDPQTYYPGCLPGNLDPSTALPLAVAGCRRRCTTSPVLRTRIGPRAPDTVELLRKIPQP